MQSDKIEDIISRKIIGAAIEVHKEIGGPGLLESVYEAALCHELAIQGFDIKCQVPVYVNYKGMMVKDPLRLDILINDKVIVEVKATEEDCAINKAQLLTYLRLKKLKLGLLINFGKEYVKDGITRVVNGL